MYRLTGYDLEYPFDSQLERVNQAGPMLSNQASTALQDTGPIMNRPKHGWNTYQAAHPAH